MDYNKLIKELKESNIDRYPIIEKCATAIESLLSERDAAIMDARHGRCMACIHGGSYGKPPCDKCVENFGGIDCWEWRGCNRESEG